MAALLAAMITTRNRLILLIAIFFVSTSIFWSLRSHRRPGGDSREMQEYVESDQSCFYLRSPLTLYLHRGVYHLVKPLGGDGATAMALCSSAAGGVYVLSLLAISAHPLFLAFNLLAGTSFLFMGHLENYAWVNALLVLYLALLRRHIERNAPLWPAASVLLLACLFHMLAVFTLPTLALAIWQWHRGRLKPALRIMQEDFQRVLIVFVVATLFMALGPLVFQAAGLDNNTQRLVPLFHNPNPTKFFFTMFAPAHFRMLGYFIWKASPLGFPVLLALCWRIRTRYEWFVLGALGCSLAWEFVWHPDMGTADWDLFASFAFPLDILGGLLLIKNKWLRGETA